MSTRTDIPPPELPDPGRLPDGALCYGCRYNLVGRTLDEQCPECGTDVAPSWPVTNEAAAHPDHLKQLRLEFLWLNALALLAALSNASLAVAALVHVISKNATAWQSVSMTLIAVGLAGWYAAYSPVLAMAVSRIRVHPNCYQMPGAWARWHMVVGTIPAAIGFLGCLVVSPIAYAISPNAGIWTIGVCGFILVTGVLVQLLGSWAYAGSTLRRTRPGTGYRADSRCLWILPVAIGAMIAIAATVLLANDTMLALLLSLLTLASVVLVQRLLRALLAIRRGEKLVRQRATPNR